MGREAETRSIIVTGASRGIGRATALRAARGGYEVCVNYRARSEAAEAVVAEIEALGGKAIAVKADVTEPFDVRQLFEAVDESLAPLHALVNNAGIVAAQRNFADIDLARFERILCTNVLGAFLCAQAALRVMSRSRGGNGGVIVNVSSVAARTGSPHEYVDYAASKGALDTMTTGLAREAAAEGVRVNLVRPGFIHTDMHADGGEPDRVARLAPSLPMKRGGEADEVARAILWLISDEANYVAGACLDVAGGL